MGTSNAISLVDPIAERREAIGQLLRGMSRETLEVRSSAQLPRASRCGGVYLAFDEADTLDDLLRHLVDSPNSCAVIALSEEIDVSSVVKAIRAGVSDYIRWPASEARLDKAIQAAEQQVSLRSEVVNLETKAKLLVEKLSKREHEVIHGVSAGWTSRKIGSLLGISARTVEIHRGNALKKLNARNSYEAVRIFYDASNRLDVQ